MFWRYWHRATPYDDDWEDQPAQSGFHQWVLGLLLPAALLAYGIWIARSREAEFGGGSESMTLQGRTAVAYGIAVISAGVFLHCHYFWGNIYNQAWFAVLGKIISAIAFIGGMGYLILSVGSMGLH